MPASKFAFPAALDMFESRHVIWHIQARYVDLGQSSTRGGEVLHGISSGREGAETWSSERDLWQRCEQEDPGLRVNNGSRRDCAQ